MEVGTIYEFLSNLSHDSLSLALNGLLLGVCLAAGTLLLWRYIKDQDAATSYAAWWLVLSAVIVAPLLLSMSSNQSSPTHRSVVTASAVAEDRGETTPWIAVAVPEESRPQEIAPLAMSWHESLPVAAPIGSSLEASSRWRDAGKLLVGLIPISLFGMWLCICLGLMARLWRAFRTMTAIKRLASPLPFDLAARARRLVRESGLSRPVFVGVSTRIKFPMAAGLGDPTILIPEYLLAKLEPAEMDAIVLHELVHLRRWDDWTKLLQRMIEAILFFNPVVHWIGRKLDQAREMACDDRVVAQTGQPTDYARCLTKLAEINVSGRGLLVPGALVNRKFIFRRLDRVLNTARPTSGRRSGLHLAAIAATVFLAVTLLVQISPAVSLPLEPLSYNQLAGGVNSLLESFAQEDGAESVEDKSANLSLADIGSRDSSLKMLALKDTQLAAIPAASTAKDRQRSSRQKPAADQDNDTSDPCGAAEEASEVEELEPDVETLGTNVLQDEVILDSDDEPELVDSSGLAQVQDGTAVDDIDETGRGRRSGGVISDAVEWVGDVFDGSWRGTMISHDDEGRTEITFNDGRNKLRVEYEGTIEFSDDDSDILSMSDGAYFYLADKRGREWSEIEIEPDAAGKLQGTYYADRDKSPFDEDARKWFKRRLAYALGNTGINASARVERWHQAGGVDKVLAEIEDIERDYARTEHLKALMGYDLSGREFSEVLVYVGRYLDSDYEKAELLIDMTERHPPDQSTVRDYIGVVKTIDSDYETRRILEAVLFEDNVDDEVAAQLLQIAGDMDSDYEKAELLVNWTDQLSSNEELLVELIAVVSMIDSDYETRRVLSRVSIDEHASEATILAVLNVAGEMDSDYEKAELLLQIAHLCRESKPLESAYLDALRDIDSDYETRRVLSALTDRRELDAEVASEVVEMAQLLDSDYEKAELLIDLARSCDTRPELRSKVVNAAATLESDYETRRVLSSLNIDCDDDADLIVSIMTMVERMSSDYETAELLVDLAECADGNAVVREAYLQATNRIGSDYEKQKCLAPLLSSDDLDAARLTELLDVITAMDSDYDQGQMIKALIPACRDNEELVDLLVEAIETIDSEYTVNELYAKLYRRPTRDIGMD